MQWSALLKYTPALISQVVHQKSRSAMKTKLASRVLVIWITGLPFAAPALPITGESIYQYCTECHGPAGEGGKAGEYPRIAGLPQGYIERQLNAFKQRKRVNKPMLPIFEATRFDSKAASEIAAYVAQLPEPLPALETFEPSAERLAEFDSREEFDELGRDVYVGTCDQCHGKDGRGRADKEAPPLVNQYPSYLRKQIVDFAQGRREHEHAEKMFGELYEEEIESLLVYLGRLSDAPDEGD